MTPEEARRLLDNFDRLLPFEAELEIEGAAKDMATMIAGMRTEYRAEQQADGGTWLPLCGWYAHDTAQFFADVWKADGYDTRIVRRYVTEPEEA